MSAADIPGYQPGGTVVDGFHIMQNGKKIRVFPGTGLEVGPTALGGEVKWAGDNIGFGEGEIVTLVDQSGNWAKIPADLVQTHEVWCRIDAYGQKSIADA